MNPLLIETVLKERKMEAEAHAKECRLINLYNRANPSFTARTLLTLGNILVKTGTRLQKIARKNLVVEKELCENQLHT